MLLSRMVEVDVAEWTKEKIVSLACTTDAGFCTRKTVNGKHLPLFPGGFFATVMVHQEYGEKANRTLASVLARHGHRLTLSEQVRRSKKQMKGVNADHAELCNRIQRDLPAWLLVRLAGRGTAKYNPLPHILLEAMDYQGLHTRGKRLLSSILWTSAGACLYIHFALLVQLMAD